MNPLKTLVFLILILTITSCAKIFNGAYQTVKFEANQPIREIVIEQDTFYPNAKSYKIDIFREKTVKYTNVVFDSSAVSFKMKSHFSNTYILGNLISPYYLGYLIDLSSDKRFGYQSRYYFNVSPDEVTVLKWKPTFKNQKRWVIASNNMNSLRVKLGGKDSLYATGLGFSVGFEKFYQDNQFLSAGINWTSDHLFPIVSGRRVDNTDDGASAVSLYCRNNGNFDDFEYGYGLQVSSFQWYSYGDFETRRESNLALGVSIMAQYRATEYLRVGFVYQPSFFRFNKQVTGMAYQHLFSFEAAWKF